ncbi:MAG: bifunctional diaminohydroxyphosphoribosylaminopyrimidine deaminase/5-amino-6-(5-phosphoribosylamino)uracil reductase RibD, partial [Syntrophomonadaceae bacterium]
NGFRKLQEAGIEVETGVLEQRSRRLNEVFWKYVQTGQPFIALKTAMTLDGKIAAYSGDSKWVTGDSARQQVHQLRNIHDGILVGIGTVLKDDPRLNTRLEGQDLQDPVRIIIDGRLQLPLDGNIARTAERQRTLVFGSNQAEPRTQLKLERMGLHVISLDCPPDTVPLEKVLEILGRMEICSVLVEGGAEINGYLLEHNLVDKVYWFIAPKLIGGRGAPTPVGGQGQPLMQEAWELKSVEMQTFGSDYMVTGYLKEW